MSKLIEEWRPVPIEGQSDKYEVSDWGNVVSLNYMRTGKRCLLSKRVNNDGYLFVKISKNGKTKNKFVHKLVAEAFLPIPEELQHLIGTNKLQVGHTKRLPDGTEDKTANEVWNIRWMSSKENSNYGTRNERMAKKLVNHPKKSKEVCQYTMDGELVKIWPSLNECSRNGFNQSPVCLCCNGKKCQYKGFIWRYKEEQ